MKLDRQSGAKTNNVAVLRGLGIGEGMISDFKGNMDEDQQG
jgi:hypothetical protein